jgi:hypothetical protein
LTLSLTSFAPPDASSRNIYREKVTGARADRRELLRMLDRLAPGDVVTVTRIDRLARSTFDLFAFSAAWPTLNATLSAPAPPRAAAGRRSAGSTWADPRN